MPVKVLGSNGSGNDVTVAAGITWAADHGAKVISLSLGSPSYSSTEDNAVQYAWSHGCVVVAAAGNDSTNALFYPAAYANVISVASTDSSDTLSSFSNWGTWVTVAAPGQSILSTMPTYHVTLNDAPYNYPMNYTTLSGTSMACPHVAGEGALLLAQNPALTNVQVSQLIRTNVEPYNPYSGRTIATGAGRIHIFNALRAVTSLYVDHNYIGIELGTPLQPFRTLASALNAASKTLQTSIYVRANKYAENPTITKNVVILNWGDAGIVHVGTL